jgi:predicted small metal-binding protein
MKISWNIGFSRREKTYKDLTMVSFTCRDLGIDCSFETTGTTEIEIMKKFIDHAESAHNMPVLTADTMLKVKKVLKK